MSKRSFGGGGGGRSSLSCASPSCSSAARSSSVLTDLNGLFETGLRLTRPWRPCDCLRLRTAGYSFSADSDMDGGRGRFSPLARRASSVRTGDDVVALRVGMGMLDLPTSLNGDLDTRPPSTTCFQLLELRRGSAMRGVGAVSDVVGSSRFAMRRGVVAWEDQPSFVVRERSGVRALIA